MKLFQRSSPLEGTKYNSFQSMIDLRKIKYHQEFITTPTNLSNHQGIKLREQHKTNLSLSHIY